MSFIVAMVVIVGVGLLIRVLTPAMEQLFIDRRIQRLQEDERLAEARLQMLTYRAIQQLSEVMQQGREDGTK